MGRLGEGIAEFENAIKLYEGASGEPYNDEANTMDLLAILLGDLGINLICTADSPEGFMGLTDHIIDMMGNMFHVTRKLLLHAVVPESPQAPPKAASMEEADEFLAALAQCQDGDEQIAAINRWEGDRTSSGRSMPKAEGQLGERRERDTATPKASERGPRK